MINSTSSFNNSNIFTRISKNKLLKPFSLRSHYFFHFHLPRGRKELLPRVPICFPPSFVHNDISTGFPLFSEFPSRSNHRLPSLPSGFRVAHTLYTRAFHSFLLCSSRSPFTVYARAVHLPSRSIPSSSFVKQFSLPSSSLAVFSSAEFYFVSDSKIDIASQVWPVLMFFKVNENFCCEKSNFFWRKVWKLSGAVVKFTKLYFFIKFLWYWIWISFWEYSFTLCSGQYSFFFRREGDLCCSLGEKGENCGEWKCIKRVYLQNTNSSGNLEPITINLIYTKRTIICITMM